MANLTKKDVQRMLTVQTKQINQRIDPIEKLLRQNTAILRNTTALLTHVVQDVSELKSDMKSVKATVDSHTTTLDSIYKNTETGKTETTSIRATIQRHEQWFSQIADKVGVRLEGLEKRQS